MNYASGNVLLPPTGTMMGHKISVIILTRGKSSVAKGYSPRIMMDSELFIQ